MIERQIDRQTKAEGEPSGGIPAGHYCPASLTFGEGNHFFSRSAAVINWH
jgi:hypothetical protein